MPIQKLSFGSTTPIIANKGSIKKLQQKLGKQPKNYYLQNATHLYTKTPNSGLLGQTVAKGKEVGFLITGPEYKKLMFMEHGWGSETAPSRHMNRAIVTIGKKFDSITQKLAKRINCKKNYKPRNIAQ